MGESLGVMTVPFEKFDHILYMQIRVANLYCKAHNLSIGDFLTLEQKTGLLPFIADAYEPFHLTGDLGILEEVDEYVQVALA
jgi:hypothetical protein